MKKRILIALVSMCWMPGVYAQDSVAVKMDLIDEYRANILAHKNEFLSVGFPLSWYADTDSIFYYFKDKHLVLIEHSSDKEIDGDTNVVRAIAYKRVFFLGNRLCLEEKYTKSYEEHYRRDENKKQFIDIYNYMDDVRTYFNSSNDRMLSFVSRRLEAQEAVADSLLNATEWMYSDISRYKYSRGRDTFISYLEQVEKNGFVLPEGVIMPYSD